MSRNIVGPVGRLVEVSKAINTNWFGSNISPITGHGNAVRHTLQVRVATTSVVKLLFDDGTDTDLPFLLNNGSSLIANAVYIFDIILLTGQSYNIQHETDTQNVFVNIVESRDITV
ncbi:hypothetical protein LCGC14_1387270 [marine sediment metagenome]|uniref:Uncharacterized protein n=1 Tax=marine sediment metagenome TaxID=412755 RepID=A0A0F9N2I0_9ZZZZ